MRKKSHFFCTQLCTWPYSPFHILSANQTILVRRLLYSFCVHSCKYVFMLMFGSYVPQICIKEAILCNFSFNTKVVFTIFVQSKAPSLLMAGKQPAHLVTFHPPHTFDWMFVTSVWWSRKAHVFDAAMLICRHSAAGGFSGTLLNDCLNTSDSEIIMCDVI